MQLELKTEGVDFVVSRAPQPKNDNDGRQKTDRDTGAPLHATELVAMDDTGAEVIKATTAENPRLPTVRGVSWLIAESGTPQRTGPPISTTSKPPGSPNTPPTSAPALPLAQAMHGGEGAV